jgi:hypothetical protein
MTPNHDCGANMQLRANLQLEAGHNPGTGRRLDAAPGRSARGRRTGGRSTGGRSAPRAHRAALLAAALVAGGAGAGSLAAVASPAGAEATGHAVTETPGNVLGSARTAVRAEAGVVETIVLIEPSGRAAITVHAGDGIGMEQGRFIENGKPAAVTVIDVGSVTYLRGDENGLEGSSFTSTAAAREADHWIAIPTSSTYGKEVSDPVTIDSAANELRLKGKLRLTSPTTLLGERVIGVIFASPVQTATIYVRASGAALPVEIDFSTSSIRETIKYADWGTAPALAKPATSVSFRTSWVSIKT